MSRTELESYILKHNSQTIQYRNLSSFHVSWDTPYVEGHRERFIFLPHMNTEYTRWEMRQRGVKFTRKSKDRTHVDSRTPCLPLSANSIKASLNSATLCRASSSIYLCAMSMHHH